MTGKQSLLFDKDVYVRCAATVVGKKEADGPLSLIHISEPTRP